MPFCFPVLGLSVRLFSLSPSSSIGLCDGWFQLPAWWDPESPSREAVKHTLRGLVPLWALLWGINWAVSVILKVGGLISQGEALDCLGEWAELSSPGCFLPACNTDSSLSSPACAFSCCAGNCLKQWAEMALPPLSCFYQGVLSQQRDKKINKHRLLQSSNLIRSAGKVFTVQRLVLITGTVRILKLCNCALLLEWDDVFVTKGVLKALGVGAAIQNHGFWRKKLQNSLAVQV